MLENHQYGHKKTYVCSMCFTEYTDKNMCILCEEKHKKEVEQKIKYLGKFKNLFIKGKRLDNKEWIEGYYFQFPKFYLLTIPFLYGTISIEEISNYLNEIITEQCEFFHCKNCKGEIYEIDPLTILYNLEDVSKSNLLVCKEENFKKLENVSIIEDYYHYIII